MNIIKRVSYISFILVLISCQGEADEKVGKVEEIINDLNGQKFVLGSVLDSTGQTVQLDFTKYEITIIDFWFKECPPCIKEMQQFERLLKGKENEVRVVSISINQFWYWKSLLQKPKGEYSFLANEATNWTQLTLGTSDNPKFKNKISGDRVKELKTIYKVEFFPRYFIVNKKGVIISQPRSAVDFLKQYKQ